MLGLHNNPILIDYQKAILKAFFATPLGKQFFLTGGTALSAFYLAHRQSKDLDFFSIEDYDSLGLEKVVEMLANQLDTTVETKVVTNTYREVYLTHRKKQWEQRIDFVKDQPVLFGKRVKIDSIIVDSLENISAGKILAMYGRFEPKDYIDLYFICKETDINFFKLFEKTKKKDLGLNEFYFANMIADVEKLKNFPLLNRPFNKNKFNQFFLDLSTKLFKKIKLPKE